MRKIGFLLAVTVFGAVFSTGLVSREVVAISDPICSSGVDEDLKKTAGCYEDDTIKSPIKTAVEVLLWVVGVICVVMVIWSGAKMTMSAGDAGAVMKAKNTLIYAVVGLVVAILAYAIVEFVIGKVG